MANISGGELLVKCLVQEGIEVVFAIPDVYNTLFAGFKQAGIRVVSPRHESAGAHMADGWSKATGKPGVVVAGAGPGTANLLPGVAAAWAESSPIVVITGGCISRFTYPDRGGAFQYFDQVNSFKPITKWNAHISQWKRIPELVRHAFRMATLGKPGPVHLDIAGELFYVSGDEDSVVIMPREEYKSAGLFYCDPAQIKAAADMMVNAERLCIHAGGGVNRSGANTEVQEIAEHLGVPVVPSAGSRGAIPEDHVLCFLPMSLGGIVARSEADVVLAIGTQMGQLQNWGRPPAWGDPSTQKVIQIDSAPEQIGLHRPADVALVGDAKAVLSSLVEEIKAATPARDQQASLKRYREIDDAWRQQLVENAKSNIAPLHPARTVKEVNDQFPKDRVLVMDGGMTSLFTMHYTTVYRPRSFLWTSKFGHLGTGLPYALAGKLANPDRPVILISGDSAFGFNIQELETARRENLPVVVVVNCDYRWGMEVPGQIEMFGADNLMGVDHYPMRYDKVAEAMGCHGEYVEDPKDLGPAIKRALDSELPAVIHVVADQDANLNAPGFETFGDSYVTE